MLKCVVFVLDDQIHLKNSLCGKGCMKQARYTIGRWITMTGKRLKFDHLTHNSLAVNLVSLKVSAATTFLIQTKTEGISISSDENHAAWWRQMGGRRSEDSLWGPATGGNS